MRRYLHILAASLLLAGVPAIANAQPAFIVVDADKGTVLNQNRSDVLWYPASITKMMTAYVTFQALQEGKLKPTSAVRISTNALAQAPSKMGFKVGTVLNVDNALKMMLVKSANDIAVAIAETVAGNEPNFVAKMNAEARRLGMASTHYNNPNGLPDGGQRTTARDQAVLARALFTDFPEYYDYFGIPAIKAGKRILRSQNKLLEQYRGTIGMKTGFICASGFNMVASARRSGRTMIAVVLGAQSSSARNETAAHLLDQGFATWMSANKPDLASFEAQPSMGAPANMHDQVCGKRVKQEDDEADSDAPDRKLPSSLVPRFVLMDPVPVFTGRADPPPGAAVDETANAITTKTSKTKVPLPRLRPRPPGASAANALAEPAASLKINAQP